MSWDVVTMLSWVNRLVMELAIRRWDCHRWSSQHGVILKGAIVMLLLEQNEMEIGIADGNMILSMPKGKGLVMWSLRNKESGRWTKREVKGMVLLLITMVSSVVISRPILLPTLEVDK